MARPSYNKLFNHGILKLVMVSAGFCLACCIIGPPLYCHFKENSRAQASCGSCDCGCNSDTTPSTITQDCGNHDPDMQEEMGKERLALLAEELHLQKNVTDDRLERTKEITMEVRKASLQYRKEVEKCSIGIETCEEARAKAEAAIVDELKLSALWEERARELGWRNGM